MTAEPILFPRLVEASDEAWCAYTRHQFVLLLASGDLPEACFRRYLVQDYLFLAHFARAWGLAIYKSDTLPEMRRAQRLVAATLDVEIGLHIDYCRGWGLSEAAMAVEPEAPETIAYTRFVLDRGLAGDRLDLEAALDHQRRGHRGVDPARHRNDDAVLGRVPGEIEILEAHNCASRPICQKSASRRAAVAKLAAR